MKLVTVLLLVALPVYCSAGSGCQYLEDVVEKVINPELSTTKFVASVQELIPDSATEKAAVELKQCFLNQSNETLTNFREMMHVIYNSVWCSLY